MSTLDRITGVVWSVNGTDLIQQDHPNIEEVFMPLLGNGVGMLRIRKIPEIYNQTIFQCRAILMDATERSSSKTLLLLLQGNLNDC